MCIHIRLSRFPHSLSVAQVHAARNSVRSSMFKHLRFEIVLESIVLDRFRSGIYYIRKRESRFSIKIEKFFLQRKPGKPRRSSKQILSDPNSTERRRALTTGATRSAATKCCIIHLQPRSNEAFMRTLRAATGQEELMLPSAMLCSLLLTTATPGSLALLLRPLLPRAPSRTVLLEVSS